MSAFSLTRGIQHAGIFRIAWAQVVARLPALASLLAGHDLDSPLTWAQLVPVEEREEHDLRRLLGAIGALDNEPELCVELCSRLLHVSRGLGTTWALQQANISGCQLSLDSSLQAKRRRVDNEFALMQRWEWP